MFSISHQSVNSKWVNFIGSKLYLNKTFQKEEEKQTSDSDSLGMGDSCSTLGREHGRSLWGLRWENARAGRGLAMSTRSADQVLTILET